MKRINTILVPVDFSKNTELAISKALEFCPEENYDTTIHLLHAQQVSSNGFSSIFSSLKGGTHQQVSIEIKNSRKQLEDFKSTIEHQRKGIKVLCWVSFGNSVQESIVNKARRLSPDMIIIGKSSHHSFFPFLNTVSPSHLAIVTGIPVLTAKPGSLHQEIKMVVIPVDRKFPHNKLEMLGALRGKSRPQIRLVIFEGNDMEWIESKQLLLDTFRVIKSQFVSMVNYEVLKGGNKAQALLNYCDKVGADVLIVYPGIETKVNKWANSHISDMVPAESKTQILAVMPG